MKVSYEAIEGAVMKLCEKYKKNEELVMDLHGIILAAWMTPTEEEIEAFISGN